MGRSQIIDLDGPVHYVDHGGGGTPLVLIHGLGGSHLNWMAVADALTAYHRVYALDLAGFGLTPLSGRRATLTRNRQLIDDFISGMGFDSPVILAGNSMGGLLVMMQAAVAPKTVAAAILVTPALPPVRPIKIDRYAVTRLALPILPFVGPAYARRIRNAAPVAQQVDTMLDMLCVDSRRLSDEIRAATLAMAQRRLHMEWAIPSFVAASRSIVWLLARRSRVRSIVDQIACPVLVIQGERDVIVPPQAARWLQERRPDFVFEFFPDAGHVPQMETPGEFVAAVERCLSRISLPVGSDL